MPGSGIEAIRELLGGDGGLLEHHCSTISKEHLHIPGFPAWST